MLSYTYSNAISVTRNWVFSGLLVLGLVPALTQAADPTNAKPALVSIERPAWLTDLSIGIKEGWDSNVYLSGVDRRFLPASFVLVPGSAAALKNLDSWVTTISPKVGVNFAPLLGNSSVFQVLALGYAPEFAEYHNEQAENNEAHRLLTTIKGQAGDLQFNLESSFNYVDGSDVAPTYPGVFLSAYSTGAPRERREQIQDRTKIVFQYSLGACFARPTASLLYYDLMTLQTNVPGYQNYPDRYDVNGGIDFGYKVTTNIAAILGYRYGHQYQEQFSFDLRSSPSDYQRVLVGLEGKPWEWLTVSLLGGPDFRDYAPDVPGVHITPVQDPHLITYYGEASLVADITKVDSLTFKYRGFQWVSSIGRVPYFDSNYDLSYRHKFGRKLTLDAGARLQTANYNSGLAPASLRNDWMYSTTLGLTYACNSHLSANVTYNVDLGRNAQDDLVNPQTREFDRHLVSAGVLLKF